MWLVRIITLVLVFQQSFENSTNRQSLEKAQSNVWIDTASLGVGYTLSPKQRNSDHIRA